MERSGETWIFNAHPQPVPQLRPAVPLPLAFRVLMVKGIPVDTGLPHPDVWDVMVANPEPLLFSVNVT